MRVWGKQILNFAASFFAHIIILLYYYYIVGSSCFDSGGREQAPTAEKKFLIFSPLSAVLWYIPLDDDCRRLPMLLPAYSTHSTIRIRRDCVIDVDG